MAFAPMRSLRSGGFITTKVLRGFSPSIKQPSETQIPLCGDQQSINSLIMALSLSRIEILYLFGGYVKAFPMKNSIILTKFNTKIYQSGLGGVKWQKID